MRQETLTQSARRTPEQTVRKNDYVTLEQCVKIAASTAERTLQSHERQRRASVWYRRLFVWVRSLWRRA